MSRRMAPAAEDSPVSSGWPWGPGRADRTADAPDRRQLHLGQQRAARAAPALTRQAGPPRRADADTSSRAEAPWTRGEGSERSPRPARAADAPHIDDPPARGPDVPTSTGTSSIRAQLLRRLPRQLPLRRMTPPMMEQPCARQRACGPVSWAKCCQAHCDVSRTRDDNNAHGGNNGRTGQTDTDPDEQRSERVDITRVAMNVLSGSSTRKDGAEDERHRGRSRAPDGPPSSRAYPPSAPAAPVSTNVCVARTLVMGAAETAGLGGHTLWSCSGMTGSRRDSRALRPAPAPLLVIVPVQRSVAGQAYRLETARPIGSGDHAALALTSAGPWACCRRALRRLRRHGGRLSFSAAIIDARGGRSRAVPGSTPRGECRTPRGRGGRCRRHHPHTPEG